MVSVHENKTLGILLATGPEKFDKNIVIEITEVALEMGIKVKIFLMDDGIYNLYDEKFTELIEKGADISLCSLNADERKVKDVRNVRFGSQFDHAEIVKNCDRYLGFFRDKMKEKKITLIFEHTPFTDIKTYEGLRMGLGLTISNNDVSFVFTDMAVHVLRITEKKSKNIPDVHKVLQMITELKKNIYVVKNKKTEGVKSEYPTNFINKKELFNLIENS